MSKWEILYGAGDVAVYNGLKKIFHVFPEEAKIVCDILNRLEDELARCKSERLGAEEVYEFLSWQAKTMCDNIYMYTPIGIENLITAFRASQQTQEGKG